MRLLKLHMDYFQSKITKKGRSKVVENFTNPETTVHEALIVLTSVEKRDETSPGLVSEKAVEEVAKLAHNLKVRTIVLHPFAHLFGTLSNPRTAIEVLKMVEEKLSKRGFHVIRTPFGWFNTLELKAKGHPLSRVQESSLLTRM